MKVTLTSPPPPPQPEMIVTITLKYSEAIALKVMLGNSYTGTKIATDLYQGLSEVL